MQKDGIDSILTACQLFTEPLTIRILTKSIRLSQRFQTNRQMIVYFQIITILNREVHTNHKTVFVSNDLETTSRGVNTSYTSRFIRYTRERRLSYRTAGSNNRRVRLSSILWTTDKKRFSRVRDIVYNDACRRAAGFELTCAGRATRTI